MKEDFTDQPMAEFPDSGQGIWLSKEEVMWLYDVTDRQLEYWRKMKWVRYEKRNHRTYYLEDEIQQQVKKRARSKKFTFIRRDRYRRKRRDIDPPFALLILAAYQLWLNGFQKAGNWISWIIFNYAAVSLTLIAGCWYLTRFLIFIYRRHFERNVDEDEEEEDDDD